MKVREMELSPMEWEAESLLTCIMEDVMFVLRKRLKEGIGRKKGLRIPAGYIVIAI